MAQLGFSGVRTPSGLEHVPEVLRAHPGRGSIAYGQTVLRPDLESPDFHARLKFFASRQTRHRSSILFFIGVEETERADLEALLQELDIRSGTRGGHVLLVSIPPAPVKAAAKRAKPS